ncbi:uncharacterized protein H6S33_003863 [Morchella sextelata]|uniref:uncharacterized protein n=1 Tax=Morchella sextelata TaxID=1174677 RepID=UPI001D04645E|nr:uncharacterized protein H6S33_003863 [Morchella sextelata]KAH0606202.1 hypothetical protein H6S33_003863 [Morchella sextelata]
MRFPDTRRDVRWQNLNMFPISILLLICNIVNIGVLSAYTSISSYYLDSFSISIICTCVISVIHLVVDIIVIPHNKLNPIYVTIMSSFYTLFWAGAVILSALSMVYGIEASCNEYDYYSLGPDPFADGQSTCGMLISSFVFSLFSLILYVAALCVGAIALGRFQKAALGRQRISYDVANYNQPNYSQRGLDDNLEIFPIPPRMELPTNSTTGRKVELSA